MDVSFSSKLFFVNAKVFCISANNTFAIQHYNILNLCSYSRRTEPGSLDRPLSVAMTGTQVSPSIEHTIYLAGREGAISRIDEALVRSRG